MFLLNLGFKINIGADIEGLQGAVLLPQGNYSHRLFSTPEYSKLMLDPQVYLAKLDIDKCPKVCSRLSSYNWFQSKNVPKIEDSENKPSKWQKEIEKNISNSWTGSYPVQIYNSCLDSIRYQIAVKCSHLILPSPLLENREEEAESLADWLDNGLEAIKELDPSQPVLATVAIAESMLNKEVFRPLGFLDTLVDQVTSREGINGVYIVVAQTYSEHPFKTSEIVNKCYLELVRKFREGGMGAIVVNFADIFGPVCLAHGATFVVNGVSYKQRSLCFKQYEEISGGRALPHYYSMPTISEYLSEKELDQIVNLKLVRRIEDETNFSKNLLSALKSGQKAGSIPYWVESQNNISFSQRHFIESQFNFVKKLKTSKDLKSKIERWLEDAEMYQSFIAGKIDEKFPGKKAPVSSWIKLHNDEED